MKLGNLLRDFEVRSDTIRFTTGQAKGYIRSDFTRLGKALRSSCSSALSRSAADPGTRSIET
jgi:hypothetical protein